LKAKVFAAVLLAVVLTSVAYASAQEQRVLLEHNIPAKVEVGSVLKVTLRFVDESSASLELESLTVAVTDPFGFETTPTLTQEGVGVYSFTQTFNIEGAYYVTVRASKYRYVSYSQRLLVDCVKSRAFLDWLFAVLNSPVIFVLVTAPVSALLFYRRFFRKKGGKKK